MGRAISSQLRTAIGTGRTVSGRELVAPPRPKDTTTNVLLPRSQRTRRVHTHSLPRGESSSPNAGAARKPGTGPFLPTDDSAPSLRKSIDVSAVAQSAERHEPALERSRPTLPITERTGISAFRDTFPVHMLKDTLPMPLEDTSEGDDRERVCQAVSSRNEICGFPATVRCSTCEKWFCDAHAEDEQWHPCVLSPGFG